MEKSTEAINSFGMKKLLFLTAILLLSGACNRTPEQLVLIDREVKLETNVSSLDEIFGNQYKLTLLEFSESSMIGNINKIVKREGRYYVMHGNYAAGTEILVFDSEGNYMSKLSRVGRGPGEYDEIYDFEVHRNGDKTELWICTLGKIMIYDCVDCSIIGEIPMPFTVTKFRRLPDDTIMTMTGQNEEALTLIDRQGNILSTYLSTSPALLGFRMVQFVPFGDKVLFYMSFTNDFAWYDWREEEFGLGKCVGNTDFMSADEASVLYDQMGMEFVTVLKNKTYVGHFREYDGKLFLTVHEAGGDMYIVVYDAENNTVKSCRYRPEPSIPNNITGSNDLKFISSIVCGDSDDSLLMAIDPANDMVINQNYAILEYFY